MLKSEAGWLFRDSDGSDSNGSALDRQPLQGNEKQPSLMVIAKLAGPIRLVAGLVYFQCWRLRGQLVRLHLRC